MRQIDNYPVNILERTKNFGANTIRLISKLPRSTASFVVGDQIVRSGTSIGANLVEAQEAVSANDFIYKINIALKEAKETRYWLELIDLSSLIASTETVLLLKECDEIVKILVATIQKLKSKR